MTIHWKAVEQYFTVVLIVFQFTQFVILEHLSILDLALSKYLSALKKELERFGEIAQQTNQKLYNLLNIKNIVGTCFLQLLW